MSLLKMLFNIHKINHFFKKSEHSGDLNFKQNSFALLKILNFYEIICRIKLKNLLTLAAKRNYCLKKRKISISNVKCLNYELALAKASF